jgi:putative SOS response-associated peptidase YedK
MCGRLDQNDISRLIRHFSRSGDMFNRSQAAGKFNVCPGTYRPLLHAVDNALFLDDAYWGYRSKWAESSGKIPVAINTRLEKITNRYWKPLLSRGRAIVPAAGWYEWSGEKGKKQPWHVHRKDRAPLYLAALAHFGPASEVDAANGFTLVTANAPGGVIDAQDRRPIVLNAADADLWLDPFLPWEQAEHLLRSVALDLDQFDWFMVDRSLGNVTREGAYLAEKIDCDCGPA